MFVLWCFLFGLVIKSYMCKDCKWSVDKRSSFSELSAPSGVASCIKTLLDPSLDNLAASSSSPSFINLEKDAENQASRGLKAWREGPELSPVSQLRHVKL